MLPRLDVKIWNVRNIADTKARIKAHLENGDDTTSSPEERLTYIIRRITELEEDTAKQATLDRFVYCMSALVHHECKGGLDAVQTRSIFEIAIAILASLRIDPQSSRIGFIYAELHLVMSQIKRREGHQWMAAWEQQVSNVFSGRENSPQMQAHQVLATAIRHMRLGHGDSAQDLFCQALQMPLPNRQQVRCRLGLIQLRRLRGEFDLAHLDVTECLKTPDLSETETIDAKWEELLIGAQRNNDIPKLLHSIQPRASHYLPTYFVEGILWRTARNYDDKVKLPVLASVARPRSLNASKLGLFFRSASAIEQFNDDAIPLVNRLEKLGAALESRHRLISVDKELLILAAAGRVLHNQGLEDLALLAWLEYRKLSQSISDQKTSDSLSVQLPALRVKPARIALDTKATSEEDADKTDKVAS